MTALPQRQRLRWPRWSQWPISLLLPTLLAAWALPLQAEPLQASDLAPLERIASEEIAAGHVPGAVILVGQDQHIVYRRAFGLRAMVPAEEAMTPDTVFDLASLTKVMVTTTAVLQLAERGRLDLDAPAARYWPAFTGQGKDSITLRQLLTHTSGLPPGLDLRGISGTNPGAVWQRLLALKPRQPASQEPVYSDLNFIVLGEIVRRVASEPLDSYARRHILAPLHMADAGFLPPASLLPRIAPTNWKGSATNGNGNGTGTGNNGSSSDRQPRRGEVHDPLAERLGGVAGNAGLFASADDLAAFAQALLAGGKPILKSSTVARMWAPQTPPTVPTRGLGWRLDAPLAANRAALPPLGAASHLGYTGTGLWLDPLHQVYVVVLSSRLHPDEHGDAGPLRAKVVAAVADALGNLPPERLLKAHPDWAPRIVPYLPKAVPAPVLTGIDVLAASDFSALQGLRVGLLTHRAGVDSAGRRSIDALYAAPGVTLAALFSPEHGLSGDREGKIGNDTDARTGLPVYSLYGATRRPTPEMLAGLDALVVDLQDVGTRFYTYASTLGYVMEAAAEQGLPVFVLDRPNPLGGEAVQGPLLDLDRRSFTGYWPLPVRHGMTLGELARLFAGEGPIPVKLTVIPMAGYRRDLAYEDTGRPWLLPSPNLPSLNATRLYPGVGIVEGAEVSVGRGTDHPFELVGAPWIDGPQLAAALSALQLLGVTFTPYDFTPGTSRYTGLLCHGVRLSITDRQALDTPALGIALAATLYRLYPDRFSLDRLQGNIGSQATLDAIRAGQDWRDIRRQWQAALEAFRAVREKYLLYP